MERLEYPARLYKAFFVDDEPSVIEYLRMAASWGQNGFEVCGDATNGTEALRALTVLRPHLVITDLRMPETGGLELIGRAQQLGLATEFIILTGHPEFDYVKQAMSHGVSDYLLKPLDPDELNVALESAKGRLDGGFLASYGFSREMWEAFRDTRNATEPPPSAVPPGSGEDFVERLTQVVELMNLREAMKIIDDMFVYCHNSGDTGRTQAMAHACVYQLAKAAHMRNIPPNDLLRTAARSILSDHAHMREAVKDVAERVIGLMLAERKKAAHDFVHQVRDMIDERFREDLSVAALAQTVYVNPVYLGNIFRKTFGVGINEYIHSRRIASATVLAMETDLTLTSIAEAVGYRNYNKFFLWFERITGQKPTQFTRNDKANA